MPVPRPWPALCAALVLAPLAAAQSVGTLETVYYDALAEDGRLFGGRAEILVPLDAREQAALATPWVTLTPASLGGVDPANRVDLVYVGDGYTAAQIGAYAAQVAAIQPTFFAKEPFKTYQNYFTVHRVDVVSNESGVDNDPVQGILRDTALDMEYWCGGTQRLLCVDVGTAYAFANNAPDVDLVCALANSSTYGGAGYPSSDLATAAATNGSAIEIVLHEFGHALGDLADEYEYGGPSHYAGGEVGAPNASIRNSVQMAALMTKWYRWLGNNTPLYDGLVSTFEGANYSETGIYRPTSNSLMRSLGRPFNLPSIEAIVFQIYDEVDPIDSASPPGTYQGTETLFVTPMQTVGHALDVQWYLDGAPIPGATGNTLDLSTLGLTPCNSRVEVVVIDDTPFVIDEARRALTMTQSVGYDLLVDGGAWSTYCTSTPNSTGSPATIFADGSTSIAANELVFYSGPIPHGALGIYFMGDSATQTPFGNGFLCVGGPVARLGVVVGDPFNSAVRWFDHDHLPPPAQVEPYETKRFQHWYRNPAGGGAGFNLSNGIRVTFCP